MRCYVPVLIRGKESEGVKFWGFGKQVYQELLGFIADPDYGDISDPTSGRDVTVEFKTKDQTGKDFPETSIRVKPNQTPITNDKTVLEKLKNQPKVTDIFKESTYEEMTKMLQNWLNPEAATAESTEAAPAEKAKTGKPANKSNIEDAAPVANVDDVASAFDSLFNK
jgi:membrane peptidoglycan carboxypeptidase